MEINLLWQAVYAAITIVLSGVAVAACLCVFQLTDFLAEYGMLMGKLFKFNVSFNDREEFLKMLSEKAVNEDCKWAEFFFRLLWCPYCLGTWFAFFFSAILSSSFGWFLVTWFSSMWVGVLLRILIAKIDTEERDA